MNIIVFVLFCLLLGESIGHFGWIAIPWVIGGYILGVLLNSPIITIIHGFIYSLFLFIKHRIKGTVFIKLLINLIVWVTIIFAGCFVFGLFFPKATEYLFNNVPINLSGLLAMVGLFFNPMTKKGKVDFMEWFNENYSHYRREE